MIRNEVEYQFQAARMGFLNQPIKIGERAEDWIDAAIVRDIVTKIRHGRWINRANPDCVNPEPGQIVELTRYSFEIADAIGIGVQEGARINLVNNSMLPPWCTGHEAPPAVCSRHITCFGRASLRAP